MMKPDRPFALRGPGVRGGASLARENSPPSSQCPGTSLPPTSAPNSGARVCAVVVVCALLAAFSPQSASAATLIVDRFDDPDPTTARACTAAPNDCSVRGAVMSGGSGADTIQLQAGTYTLTRAGSGDAEHDPSVGDLDLAAAVMVIGVNGTVIDAAGANDRAFEVFGSGTFRFTRVEIRGGRALTFLTNNSGGGITNLNSDATVILTGVTLRENQGGDGGGVHSVGPLDVSDSIIRDNVSNGINAHDLTVTNSTISGNRGGIHASGTGRLVRSSIVNNEGSGFEAKYAESWTISESTLSGNSEHGVEWLDDEGDSLTIVNSTMSDNGGTGLLAGSAAAVSVTNCTIVRNNRGMASLLSETVPSVINYRNSLIADNGTDCFSTVGIFSSQGFNLDSDGSCAQVAADATAANPRLAPLADNGGPTPTVALLPGSPAINGGNDAVAPEKDQRGFGRKGASDIGAFEFEGIGPDPTEEPSRLGNISTRARVQTGDRVLIGGFIIRGEAPKKVIVRAIGPSLEADGQPVPGRLQDPTLELYQRNNPEPIATNDNWQESSQAEKQEITDSGVPPSHDRESAIVRTLGAGEYTAIVRGVDGTRGIGLVEVYDLNREVDSELANLSTRGFVEVGDNVMIGGVIVVGDKTLKVIVRAIGPSLAVPDKLADPFLELRSANGDLIVDNDNWREDGQEQEIKETGVPPSHNKEAAIVRTLPPGSFTAVVRGVGNVTGVALVEVYRLD